MGLISDNGIPQRDRLVFERCERAGLPMSAVIGGGYQRDLQRLVRGHLNLFIAAGVVPSSAPSRRPDSTRRREQSI
jgi:hypothetical protein